MDLDKLISLSDNTIKPWMKVVYILGFLLLASVIGNIYQSLTGTQVNIVAESNTESTVSQYKG